MQITKLTCGSLITFYDSHRPDATVAVDVCLTALILAKVKISLGFRERIEIGILVHSPREMTLLIADGKVFALT